MGVEDGLLRGGTVVAGQPVALADAFVLATLRANVRTATPTPGWVSASSANVGPCTFGITSTCVGACGLTSRKARARSVSANLVGRDVAGDDPAEQTGLVGLHGFPFCRRVRSLTLEWPLLDRSGTSPAVLAHDPGVVRRSCNRPGKPDHELARVSGMTTLSGFRGRDRHPERYDVAPSQRWDADDAVTQLYAAHYTSLVRLAALLVRHSGEAEEIVQDTFVAMHGKWRRLRSPRRRSAICARPWSTAPGRPATPRGRRPTPAADQIARRRAAPRTTRSTRRDTRTAVMDALAPASAPAARGAGAPLLQRPHRA